MFIDVVAVILLAVAFFKGIRKGLIVAVFSFFAFLIGLAAALKLSAAAAEYLSSKAEVSGRWLPFLSFFLVFIVVVFLVRIGAKFVEGAARIVMLGWLNRLGGIIFYTLIYFFIFSIILFYAVQLHLIKKETTEASATYSIIQPLAPKIISAIGSIIPFFKDIFSDLLDFFGKVSEKHQQA